MIEFTLRRTLSRAKFPNRIREYRLKAGLTQKKLGQLVGNGRGIISSWERGRRLPNLPNVFRLARTLGTLAESLYGGLYFPPREDQDSKPRNG
jgi:transcriptional regulator with XRE-family HTH domain